MTEAATLGGPGRQAVLLSRTRNPWGRVPFTAGGNALSGQAERYVSQLLDQHLQPDPPGRRHHYVPRTYLRAWSFDGRRIWALDTVSREVKAVSLADVCVGKDFYRVTGPSGAPHNRVELLFGVVDRELSRVQRLFLSLSDPEELSFDDLLGLGVTMAVQRMRTAQSRRLQQQLRAWMEAQQPTATPLSEVRSRDPYWISGFHTELTFSAMWDAADVLLGRQIEVWDDPKARFLTCDAPVLVPFNADGSRPALYATKYVLWPISPSRAVVLSDDHIGEKAVIRRTNGRLVGLARRAVEQGRERMIFGPKVLLDSVRSSAGFAGRAQARLRCSDRTPQGEVVPPPGCCVEHGEGYGLNPDVQLCERGLHRPAPAMLEYC